MQIPSYNLSLKKYFEIFFLNKKLDMINDIGIIKTKSASHGALA